MQVTLVNGNVEVGFLGVNLVDVPRGHGGRVEVDDVKRSRRAFRSILGLRDIEVPNAGSACSPSRAKNLVVLAVQVTQVRRCRVSRKEEDGFLTFKSQ